MIDWLTLSLDISLLPEKTREYFESNTAKIVKISPEGEQVWCVAARESIRSDTHQLTVSYGSALTLTGSPARVDNSHNMFGSSDIQHCAAKMIGWASNQLNLEIPAQLSIWRCTRVDFNHNYFLGSADRVRSALFYLSHMPTGRYKKQVIGTTVEIGSRRSNIFLKIYHKGAHLQYQIKKDQASATMEEQELAMSLLRPEIKLNNSFIKNYGKPWYDISPGQLESIYENHISPMIGNVEVNSMSNTAKELIYARYSEENGYKPAYANRIYGHYLQIKSEGLEVWRARQSNGSFYNYRKALFDAGLSYADLTQENDNVVPIRREPINIGQPITSLEQLRQIARG